ncbi:TldD/PmbA family protein [Pseudooceanicola sp. 216_PA32_1]|uniref:TldD/PmbA family protein n=1 Tax=Pseudooceanicola pacificus TaxID=2676438 RepID=A0A844WA83_9RHOB|nr:metallopeptidase TldD-related protein [Pseudooceanicola pacificus]MWB76562.1 TldD/PmbA family protein [Pseudooceanicola pacificus]
MTTPDQTAPLSDIAAALIAAARKAGAGEADVLVRRGTSISVDVRAGALEQAERSEGIEMGLRVLIGQRQACVSASDIRAETMQAVAERAVAMAREAPEDKWIGLADPSQLATETPDLDLCDPAGPPLPAELEEAALRAEAAALAVEGVSQAQGASASYSASESHLAATNGFSAAMARSSGSISCSAIAGTGTGMERDHDFDHRIYRADLRAPEEIGERAAQRAVERLGARKPQTGAYPVLFDERISSSIIGHLLGAVNGGAIARGASFLRGSLGERILPAGLSVIEDAHRPRVFGSRPFDGEGLATGQRDIVRDGMLCGWTLDLANARKLGMAPTGNGARGLSSPPSPAAWNVALTQGSASRADLMRDMGTGLLVTSMIGSTINPNTGDYSRGASGFWVENGEPVYPVNECTIAGNLRDMFLNMVPANDARAWMSHVVPSLLIEGLTLAGQ